MKFKKFVNQVTKLINKVYPDYISFSIAKEIYNSKNYGFRVGYNFCVINHISDKSANFCLLHKTQKEILIYLESKLQ